MKNTRGTKYLLLSILLLPFFLFSQNSKLPTDSLLNAGNSSAAIELLKKESSPDAQYQLALLYLQTKEYKKALKTARKLSRQDPTSTSIGLGSYLIQISAYSNLEKENKAEKVYESAFEKYPLHYLLYFNYGMQLMDEGNLELAEEHIQKSILLNPSHAEGHFLLSELQKQKGKRIKAILPLYAGLIYSTDPIRNAAAVDSLQNLLYHGIQVVQENGLTFTLPFSRDEENPELQSLEILLNDLNLNTPGIPEEEIDKLKVYTFSIFRFLSENHKGEMDIWWGLYGRLINDLYEKELTTAFIYSLFEDSQTEVYENYLEQNQDYMKEYRSWREEIMF